MTKMSKTFRTTLLAATLACAGIGAHADALPGQGVKVLP